jgi:hypothetical protein
LRYALLIIGDVQLLSIWIASRILDGCRTLDSVEQTPAGETLIPALAGD